MPSACCAVGCSNSKKKGFKIYRLPQGKKNQKRLEIWLSKIQRKDHFNHAVARLCEAHFEADQFEKNIPGKLKRTAIPTIFSHRRVPKLRQASKICASSETNASSQVTPLNSAFSLSDHQYFAPENDNSVHIDEIPQLPSSVADEVELDTEDDSSCTTTCKKKLRIVKKQHDRTRQKLDKLQKEHENGKQNISKFLNPDQIRVLELGVNNTTFKWSDETIKKALQLRLSCGFHGYEALLSQGFPLPSDRTLRRRLEKGPFDSGHVPPEVLNMLSMKTKPGKKQQKDFQSLVYVEDANHKALQDNEFLSPAQDANSFVEQIMETNQNILITEDLPDLSLVKKEPEEQDRTIEPSSTNQTESVIITPDIYPVSIQNTTTPSNTTYCRKSKAINRKL